MSGAARWRITADKPSIDLGSDGRFSDVREISFELLDTGSQGTIRVALRNYNPEQVAAAVQAYADNILAVSKLGQ